MRPCTDTSPSPMPVDNASLSERVAELERKLTGMEELYRLFDRLDRFSRDHVHTLVVTHPKGFFQGRPTVETVITEKGKH